MSERRRIFAQQVLGDRWESPLQTTGSATAPANVALCKYWGKRDEDLHLPVTGSLSISMADKGTAAQIEPADQHRLWINGKKIDPEDSFAGTPARRMFAFLDLFGVQAELRTRNTIPVGAGLASSASAFAAVVQALDAACGWELTRREQSLLARLGSGSACRSIAHGFVEWRVGEAPDGLDSFAEPLPATWPELRVGILTLCRNAKPVGSSDGMRRTVETSALYASWPDQVAHDLPALKQAIDARDMEALGRVAEQNALAMHATMLAARPAVMYWLPESVQAMQQVTDLRRTGHAVAFTMDAGPNLKLLFEASAQTAVEECFEAIDVLAPFGYVPD